MGGEVTESMHLAVIETGHAGFMMGVALAYLGHRVANMNKDHNSTPCSKM
jgi:UDP-glucose 6-dehydrogenase